MTTPKRFGIWGNTENPIFWVTLPGIMAWAKERDLEVFFTTRIVDQLEKPDQYQFQIIQSPKEFTRLDFILALGGDGTILSAARAICHRQIPILGIHLGDLGFLAKVTLNDLYARLDQVTEGKFTTESRQVIQADIFDDQISKTFTALNEFVIDNGNSQRMLTFQLIADDRFVGNYKADGIIVATPTGSTAYSLSAGGPIVAPDVSSLVVTPICPHSLTSRPLVLPDSVVLEISFPDDHIDDAGITVDGQITEHLNRDSHVIIKKADYTIPFISFGDSSYFQTLRTKMGWGQRGDTD